MYMYINIYIYIYIYVYVCVCVCVRVNCRSFTFALVCIAGATARRSCAPWCMPYTQPHSSGVAPFNLDGLFMATFGSETIPMTAFGGSVNQTRFRTHYYNCPIVIPFMYSENPLYNNSNVVDSITYLLKSQGNGQMNYDTALNYPISFTTGAPYYSY